MSLRFSLLCASIIAASACALPANSTEQGATATSSASTDSAAATATSNTAATSATTDTAAASSGDKPYTVVDGNKVDAHTLEGWKTWRALSCARCHGAKQEGLVGPSLIDALKVLTPEEFKHTVLDGRVPRGMPAFGGVDRVVQNIDNLYAYLKGRSNGDIEPGHVYPIEE